MTKILPMAMLSCLSILSACTDPPQGRWEATDQVEVYAESDDTFTVKFHLAKGDVCAISPDVKVTKSLGYQKVACPQGDGWIINDNAFRKLG